MAYVWNPSEQLAGRSEVLIIGSQGQRYENYLLANNPALVQMTSSGIAQKTKCGGPCTVEWSWRVIGQLFGGGANFSEIGIG